MSFLPAPVNTEMPVAPSPWQEMFIQDFSGGLYTSSPESVLEDNQFAVLNNLYHEPNGSLITRGPYRPWLVTSEDTVLTTAPLTFAVEELNGTTYRVASRDAGSTCQVEYYDEDNNAWTAIKTGLTDGYQIEFAKFSVNDRDDLIICNGVDTPQRWTGSVSTSNLGLTAPTTTVINNINTAAGTETVTATGPGTSGTYYYKLTYFYESSTSAQRGESNSCSNYFTSGIISPSSGNRVKIEFGNLPSMPTGVTRIYVYRAPANNPGGIYRRVGTITSGTSFTDNVNDGEEGIDLPIDDGSVPVFKHPCVFKGRVWAVDGSLENKVVYSQEGSCDIFPALNYFYFPNKVRGIKPFKENLYFFTEKQIYVVPNADVDSYPEPLKISDKGCTCFASVVDVGNGLMWQGEDGIYWADFNLQSSKDGDYPIPVGEAIEDKIQEIPVLYRTKSTACLYRNRYYISFAGPGQTVNSRTLVWDVRRGAEYLRRGMPGAWSSVDWSANWLVNNAGTLYSADNANKYIMEHDWAGVVDYTNKTNYDGGTSSNIITELKTKRFHFDHEWSDKIIRSMSIVAETSGVTFNARAAFNYSDHEKSQTFTLGSGSPSYATDWLVWGQGAWGDFKWGASTYQIYSDHKGFGAGSKGKNVQFTISSSNSKDTSITLLKFYYKILPPPS